MLNTILFIFSPLLVELRHSSLPSLPSKLVQGTCRFTPIRIGCVVWMLGSVFCCAWFLTRGTFWLRTEYEFVDRHFWIPVLRMERKFLSRRFAHSEDASFLR